ncbi:MAG: TIGR02996 domain-containing protein [Polyangiaceae bacterium]
MNPVEARLLAAVWAAPASDGPRLVYADYLLESGQPRGRFIAMQCAKEEHARDLLVSADASWMGPIAPAIVDVRECIFARGFPVTARVRKSGWPTAELAEHPAWSTYSRVTVPRDAKRRFPELLAHLERLGVEVLLEPAPSASKGTKKDLALAAKSVGNDWWHGTRALSRLGADEDRSLVEIAMRKGFTADVSSCGRTVADAYVPLAWSVLSTMNHPAATFLRNFDAEDDGLRLRAGAEWLHALGMVYIEERMDALLTVKKGAKLVQRLTMLSKNNAGITAARATVAAHGLASPRFVAVIAYEGSPASRDVLAPLVHAVLRGEVPDSPVGEERPLDLLQNWLLPFATGAVADAFVAKVRAASNKRGEGSTVLGLAARFGSKEKKLALDISVDSKEVYMGLTRKAYVWLRLNSHKEPCASISIVKAALDSKRTDWDDGALAVDALGLGGPTSLDDIPRWVAASAKELGVRWDRDKVRVSSSLRGKARAAALDWLLGSR